MTPLGGVRRFTRKKKLIKKKFKRQIKKKEKKFKKKKKSFENVQIKSNILMKHLHVLLTILITWMFTLCMILSTLQERMHKICTIRSFISDFYRILFTCARPSVMSGAHENCTFFWFHKAIYTYFLVRLIVHVLKLRLESREIKPHSPSAERAFP